MSNFHCISVFLFLIVQALEGAVAGLEVAQSEGLRRLSSSMSGALSEEREVIAATVRDEVWQSLEAVRQLPQVLAAATAPGLAQNNGTVSHVVMAIVYYFEIFGI